MATIELPEKIEAGTPIPVQLSPLGRFPQIVDGEEVVQILDDASVNAVAAAFKADKDATGAPRKVLVDADHESETGKGTKAEAWVTDVYVDPEKGLMGTFEFTDIGADDVNEKRYRFISPAWTLDEEGRPTKLVSVGMTNRPNLPVAPVLNSRVACVTNSIAYPGDDTVVGTGEGDAEGTTQSQNAVGEAVQSAGTNADDQSAQFTNPESNEGNPEMDEIIKQIRERLTLPEDATPETIVSAIDALIARCGTAEAVNEALGLDPAATNEDTMEALNAVLDDCGKLQAQNEEMETAQKNADADAFVAENEDLVPEPEEQEALKEEYLEDPAKAEQTVANMRRAVNRAILNMKAKTVDTVRRVVNTGAARRPKTAVNSQADALAACNGDPAKENEYLKSLNK